MGSPDRFLALLSVLTVLGSTLFWAWISSLPNVHWVLGWLVFLTILLTVVSVGVITAVIMRFLDEAPKETSRDRTRS